MITAKYMKFTCIECEHSFDDTTGDFDERMCFECLDNEEHDKETK